MPHQHSGFEIRDDHHFFTDEILRRIMLCNARKNLPRLFLAEIDLAALAS